MAAPEASGGSQLQRIVRELQDAVAELAREYRESGEPITDDSSNLHRFSYKLEYLLQFDLKEKVTFLGTRKDYWDYFSDCLAKLKGASDGIRFVRSISELKTSLGKGRAFIRYSLVHQRLADTLQQCLMNQRVTSDWYYARSPFMKPHLSADIINHLYELNDIQFDVASRGHDLDAAWPTFARRTLGGSPAHLWRPPSRSSSINSLVSSYSQVQDFPSSPDLVAGEAAYDAVSPCAADDLRLQLDQSELRQRELLGRVVELGQESSELRAVVEALQGQLDTSLATQEAGRRELEALRVAERLRGATEHELRAQLATVERKNAELLAKLDGVLDEKSLHATSYLDSAQKIHGLLDELNQAESARLEVCREVEMQRQESRRLAEEMRIREGVLAEERAKADGLQGALAAKQKASGSLERQLEDLKHTLEVTVVEATEERKKAQEEKLELQQRFASLRDSLEGQIHTYTQQLKAKDEEASVRLQKIEHLEKQMTQLAVEKQGLVGKQVELQVTVKDQARKMEDYQTRCSSLEELNGKLLQTKKELTEAGMVKESKLAALHASEKQLRSQIDDAAMALDEREKKQREENRCLDEGLRRAVLEKETVEGAVRELEQESQHLKKELEATKGALSSTRQELRAAESRVVDQEGSLAESQRTEAGHRKQLQEVAERLQFMKLQTQELEAKMKELAEEKKDAVSSLMLVEGQLELNVKEVSRLQAELLDLRAELRGAVEDKRRTEGQLNVAETSREELATLLEKLKGQEEELRGRQVEMEEEMRVIRDHETQVRAELVPLREELSALKTLHENLVLERAEAQEGLHRANTETAELGVAVCRLTSENQEAARRLEEVAREAERLRAGLAALRQENTSLCEELAQSQNLTQTALELKEQLEQATSIQEAAREEVKALKFQMSSEALNHQNQLKGIGDEVGNLKGQLTAGREKSSLLEARVLQLEAANSDCAHQMEEKMEDMARSDAKVRQAEEDLQQLRGTLVRTEEELSVARKGCEELRGKLDRAAEERQVLEMKTTAEIEDLCKTKSTLEERLIELIRDKDALWQKSDALEFEQKLRAEEQWWLVDKEADRCQGCRSTFTWWLRRHHCSNNFAMTKHSGKKERCCRECYSQHCAVVERLTQAAVGSNQDTPTSPCPPSELGPAPYTPIPRVTVTDPSPQSDDAAFDIITEEDLDGIYDGDSACPSDSTGDAASEDPEGVTLDRQDAEIQLLKSGVLTSAVPLTLEDVSHFGEGPRELFIRSSCYSVLSITMPEPGPTVSWVFSSEPKSIAFSVVYREVDDAALEQAKVLIPLTRCNSHQETIQGQLKVRRPGVYTLLFDNSYSRFISKNIFYHLTVEKPVIYDGSDS
ncbi:FYVE and coiled-coil domain-containing protein 1 isoform X2 [Paramormyrops kingsleyae]|uniref:FYVE and coiled-coil domain-containing protein 1 isoform X2 n=1 Tax=Paramormyrops kingsleyae TaxID=1676925 RepID=UPI003B97323B